MTTSAERLTHPSLWRNTDWVRLWAGNAVSTLGATTAGIAYPLVAYALTRSVGAASVVAAASSIGFVLVGLLAGSVVDRVDRRRVMVLCDLVGLGTYVAFGLLLWRGLASWWAMVALAAITGGRQALTSPAHTAAVRRVAGAEQVPTAIARQQAATAATQMAGPPLGGLAYAAGPAVPFLASAVTFVVDLALVLGIRRPLQAERRERVEGSGTGRGRRAWSDATAGFRFLWGQATMRAALVFIVLLNLCSGMFYVGLNLRLVSAGVTPALIGAVDAAGAAGTLVGALVAEGVVARVPLGRLVMLGAGLLTATWVPLAFAGTRMWLIWALVFVMLLGIPATNAGLSGYVQAVTPDELQGRVASASLVLSAAAIPLGPLLAGAALTAWGPVVASLVPAIAAGVAGALVSLDPGIRSVGTPETWVTAPATPGQAG